MNKKEIKILGLKEVIELFLSGKNLDLSFLNKENYELILNVLYDESVTSQQNLRFLYSDNYNYLRNITFDGKNTNLNQTTNLFFIFEKINIEVKPIKNKTDNQLKQNN